MQPIRTLILLANEHHARLIAHPGKGGALRQMAHHSHAEWADDAVIYADREGRMRKGEGPISGLDRSTSERTQERAHFSAHVLAATGQEWAADRYDSLVIAAPAKMLGALRHGLPVALASALHGDLDSDLLHLPLEELGEHLAGLIVL